jgi:hypothetical protein
MIRISSLALAAGLAAAAIASPAFAQSYAAAPATTTTAAASHHAKVAARQSGLNAFAMVPHQSSADPNDPALTGGGSAGYNRMLYEF